MNGNEVYSVFYIVIILVNFPYSAPFWFHSAWYSICLIFNIIGWKGVLQVNIFDLVSVSVYMHFLTIVLLVLHMFDAQLNLPCFRIWIIFCGIRIIPLIISCILLVCFEITSLAFQLTANYIQLINYYNSDKHTHKKHKKLLASFIGSGGFDQLNYELHKIFIITCYFIVLQMYSPCSFTTNQCYISKNWWTVPS